VKASPSTTRTGRTLGRQTLERGWVCLSDQCQGGRLPSTTRKGRTLVRQTNSAPLHAFENAPYTLSRIKCFSSTLLWRILIKEHVWILCWGKLAQWNHTVIAMSSFSKSSVFKLSPIHIIKREACVFEFLRIEEHFLKASFSWRISVDGRPDRRNNAAFSGKFLRRSVEVASERLSSWVQCASH